MGNAENTPIDLSSPSVTDVVNYLYDSGYLSNPNILINWYLIKPVIQPLIRNIPLYIDISVWYTFFCQESSFIGSCTRVTWSDTEHSGFVQKIENSNQLIGKTITISALVRFTKTATGGYSSLYLYSRECTLSENVAYADIPDSGTPQLLTRTFVVPEPTTDYDSISPLEFTIAGQKGFTDIYAVKCEVGDHQTLAHQDAYGNWVLNDPPPNYQQELAKCQRYIEIVPYENYWSSEIAASYMVDKFRTPDIYVVSNNGTIGKCSYYSADTQIWTDFDTIVMPSDGTNGPLKFIRSSIYDADIPHDVTIGCTFIAVANIP